MCGGDAAFSQITVTMHSLSHCYQRHYFVISTIITTASVSAAASVAGGELFICRASAIDALHCVKVRNAALSGRFLVGQSY